MAAGVSYGSLALTDFRGFSQFGIIGALGMTFCWLATFSVLPATVSFLDRRGWMRVRGGRRRIRGPMTVIAPLAVRHHRALAVGTVLLSLVAIWGRGAPFEEHDRKRFVQVAQQVEHGARLGLLGQKDRPDLRPGASRPR